MTSTLKSPSTFEGTRTHWPRSTSERWCKRAWCTKPQASGALRGQNKNNDKHKRQLRRITTHIDFVGVSRDHVSQRCIPSAFFVRAGCCPSTTYLSPSQLDEHVPTNALQQSGVSCDGRSKKRSLEPRFQDVGCTCSNIGGIRALTTKTARRSSGSKSRATAASLNRNAPRASLGSAFRLSASTVE